MPTISVRHIGSKPDSTPAPVKRAARSFASVKPSVEPVPQEVAVVPTPQLIDHSAARERVEGELARGASLSVIELVDAIIEHGYTMRASDVHIDPRRTVVTVRFRIDGAMHEMHQLPKAIAGEVVSRVKILAGLRTDEHQAAQDGRFRFSRGEGVSIDVRVSIAPTYYGENAVMRLLVEQAEAFTLDSLGFSLRNQEKILEALRRPHGMILATGPTGSGKTTTLYTLIRMLNQPDVSIITIEDPIEYSIDGIEQIQVNQRTSLTFANGLRSVLRQDPDIIMVGEIRDSETAGIGVNTALTGHLLLSTLHTNDSATTLPRLLDLKIEPYLIASTVNVAIGQRLVRKICEGCKIERPLTQKERQGLSGLLPATKLRGKSFYVGTGCVHCSGSGFLGRVGIHEVLVVDKVIREAILGKSSAAEIKGLAIENGMVPLIEDGFEKAALGLTTIEEIIRTLYE